MAYPRTVTTTFGHAAAIKAGLKATFRDDARDLAAAELADMFREMAQALGMEADDLHGIQRAKFERYSATLSDLAAEISTAASPVGGVDPAHRR